MIKLLQPHSTMTGFCIDVWLILFAVSVRVIEVKMETTLKRGLYSRVELTGETLDQQTADSLISVEWTKTNKSSRCACFRKYNNNDTHYSQCCGKAHFYISNNSLILENVTKQDEGLYMETIALKDKPTKHQNFTLIIDYPPNTTEIQVSWSSSTSMTLTCNVSGSFLHLMWKREGVSILEDERHSFSDRNQTLHISNISSSDYSTYSCIVSNEYGQSEMHKDFTSENSTINQGNTPSGKRQMVQIVFTSGLVFFGVLGLCVIFYCLHKHQHRQRGQNDRTTTDEGSCRQRKSDSSSVRLHRLH
ncbi:HEPACAM family member 2 isoform X2 [Danio rerio]|uniref:HEPACAM family member 2 isoform X2 n=1 Tax=Danio rerio TaxID=7955 RepID=A0AC58GN28_DANRE